VGKMSNHDPGHGQFGQPASDVSVQYLAFAAGQPGDDRDTGPLQGVAGAVADGAAQKNGYPAGQYGGCPVHRVL